MKKAVVIFSGGQDSVTCLYWALQTFDVVHAITFSYGQKHTVEIEQAKKICELLKVTHVVVNFDFMQQVVDSALTNNGDVNLTNKKGLPASFVPNRNQLFITIAHAYAQKIEAEHLVTGVCQTDYSGYPDCRQVFIDAIKKATNLGADEHIAIHTPLMYLNKAEIFRMAKSLNCLTEVIEYSHTCYDGDREHKHAWGYGCGECPACKLRAKGYSEFLTLTAGTNGTWG